MNTIKIPIFSNDTSESSSKYKTLCKQNYLKLDLVFSKVNNSTNYVFKKLLTGKLIRL